MGMESDSIDGDFTNARMTFRTTHLMNFSITLPDCMQKVLILQRSAKMAGLAEIFDPLKMRIDPLYNWAEFPFPGKRESIKHGSCEQTVRTSRAVSPRRYTHQVCSLHNDRWPFSRTFQSLRKEIPPIQPCFRLGCNI